MPQPLTDIHSALDEIVDHLPQLGKRVPAVSGWSIGQHIEHVLKATSAFAVLIARNQPSESGASDLSIKCELLDAGAFPRGIVDAPDVTKPSDSPTEAAIQRALLKCRKRVDRLATVQPDATAVHPYLGPMQRDEVIDFLLIHLKHHLSIIDDIVKAEK